MKAAVLKILAWLKVLPNKMNADGMTQSKPWESVIQLCYVANMRLVCNVHADVAQPSMADTDSCSSMARE